MLRRPSSSDINDSLEFAVSSGAGFAELFFESTGSRLIECADGRIERISSGTDTGFGLRLISGDRTAYGYSSVITRGEMMRVAAAVLGDLGATGKGSFTAAGEPASYGISAGVSGGVCDDAGTGGDGAPEGELERKAELVRAADRAARSAGAEIKQVRVRYSDRLRSVSVFNSEGVAVSDTVPQVVLSIRAVSTDGNILQTGMRSKGGQYGLERLCADGAEGLAREAGESAIRMLHSPHAPAGRMTVVLSGKAGGTMIHEAIGHGLEGDAVFKDLSIYSGRLGEKVASPLVTVIDDATLEGRRGSYRVDDEGTPAQRTVAVEEGILKGYLLDRRSAGKLGMRPTGNGRRENFRFRPIVRMSNTMIAPGGHDPEEIIAGVESGLFVVRMGGGQVDTSSGDFVFKVSEAYLIESGRVKGPVRGATLVGNGPAVLERIDMVGNDPGFDIGTCGKDGQQVPVADAQPTIRIPGITVGGTVDGDAAAGGGAG
jgi:TldD protein